MPVSLRLVVLALCLTASPALALTGANTSPGARPPDGVSVLASAGAVCAAGSTNAKVWWSELGAQAIVGSDGSCTSVPPAAETSLAAVERGRGALRSMGLVTPIGDAVPALRITGAYRTLLRLSPTARARALRGMSTLRRGRLLSGFSTTQRTRLLRGLPTALQRTLRKNLATAQRGRPQDFVGGDRRVDVVLHPNNSALGSDDGRTRCRWNSALRGSTRFISASMIIVTPDATANVTTVAHELVHVAQCTMGIDASPAELLIEGSAEWGAAALEPLAFAGTGTSDGQGNVAIDGGAASAARFCNRFAPYEGGLETYRSWPVWGALEAELPGTIAAVLTQAVAGTLTTTQSQIAFVGASRWSAALLRAATSVCLDLRSPSGATSFPTQVHNFVGWDETATLTVHAGQPQLSVAVPAGGTVSARADWQGADGSVSVAVDGIAPSQAQAHLLVANLQGMRVMGQPDPSGLVISRAAAGDSRIHLTFANPSTTTAVVMTVTLR